MGMMSVVVKRVIRGMDGRGACGKTAPLAKWRWDVMTLYDGLLA